MDNRIHVDKFFEQHLPSGMSTEEYQRLCGVMLWHPDADLLCSLDPFSNDYKNAVMSLYFKIRGRKENKYDPLHDEASQGLAAGNIFANVSPWSFRNSKFVSEMLYSWGHIFNHLDIKETESTSVLEYGPGSGQILLSLARLGCETYAVDIDQPSLDSITKQADAMNLRVHTEKGVFGGGFETLQFDRIVFFEAFHHSVDCFDLLSSLRKRLKPGGFVVFCGEPVVPNPSGPIPYPWGPRLDGLSAFCIRRFGWMELGFTLEFFGELLNRTGWRVCHYPFAMCGRADVFKAFPLTEEELNGNYSFDLRSSEPGALLSTKEWAAPESTHRWTLSQRAVVPLLQHPSKRVNLELDISNFLPVKKISRYRPTGRAPPIVLWILGRN